ncbi:glycosyltransferase [Agromyces sp. NPDC056523]|uniref:glycosyltransferase n=1 Tax=Agromyces sp. NPDC056523 TaxID=3345850 RepID=UPI00366D0398
MGVQTALDAIRRAPTLIDAMRSADDLAFEAGRDPGVRTIRVLADAVNGADQLLAIAAVHALGGVMDRDAGRQLAGLLSDERRFIREHAAWALGSGLPRFDAIGRLLGMVVSGGFPGMLAQRALEQWTDAVPEALVAGLEGAMLGIVEPEARARLVETLGLVRDRLADAPLARLAADEQEPDVVRAAAVAALGDRPADQTAGAVLHHLADRGGPLAEVARLALIDRSAADRQLRRRADGCTIAQLFLHADIDPELSAAGAGDNGGIATLLVRLGDALTEDPAGGIARVVTLSRGSGADAVADALAIEAEPGEPGHAYARIPMPSESVPAAQAWPLRVAARRGIRRALRAAGGVDLLHLRMAEVGSLAASEVARELGIPVVFTVAPDPHGVIDSLDRSGRLTRDRFGDVDAVEHFWFRARLVQRLAANAAHTVVFPRPRLRDDLRRLVGIDLDAHAERHTIVPEGVDLVTAEAALDEASAHADGAEPGPALAELRRLLEDLAPERRGLPLIVTAGRLHRVKGMAALVDAWATGPLAVRANLLVIGGDLERPSADEREQLDRIDAIVPPPERSAAGLILAGHRPNDVTARWLAAVRVGVPRLAAPRGVYACASLKEEFGLALLEAMAVGLFVVAPDGGGPATYVADGDTGLLTATWDPARLADALEAAVSGVAAERDDGRAERSRAMVREHFTIQRMARTLAGVYVGVARDEAALLGAVDRTAS